MDQWQSLWPIILQLNGGGTIGDNNGRNGASANTASVGGRLGVGLSPGALGFGSWGGGVGITGNYSRTQWRSPDNQFRGVSRNSGIRGIDAWLQSPEGQRFSAELFNRPVVGNPQQFERGGMLRFSSPF